MNYNHYGVCPTPTCDVIKVVPGELIWNGEKRFCPKCGKALMIRCPSCLKWIEHRDGVYCFHCGKPFKTVLKLRPQPQQNLSRKRRSRPPSK